MAGPKVERIGLLFVHGVGEQARFGHLISSVRELSELMLQTEPRARITVVDRTPKWKLPPGRPDPKGVAPITMTFIGADHHIVYECHEVWWADLGARSGILDTITFWLWGLGQWCAPIYRDLDCAHLPKVKLDCNEKPVTTLATTPESVVGSFKHEPLARLQLLVAALATVFIACTWVLAKRVFAKLLGTSPSPTVIVRYVGDVRTYEERARPGGSAISDPGQPQRVGIRRRMVPHMVALGASDCDGWYVVAHSLGTVVAYNGLTEIGHALPNYLTEAQWRGLPDRIKTDPGCERRTSVAGMMPARPGWLDIEDRINRPELFKGLRGFLTYGSPLDKFAGLWPRIVATATDRKDGRNPFPDGCRWINLASPCDPVAGILDSFCSGPKTRFPNALPKIENTGTPWTHLFGLAHIRYFAGAERSVEGLGIRQKRAAARWLIERGTEIPIVRHGLLFRLLFVHAVYLLIVAFVAAATTALVVLALGAAKRVAGETSRLFEGGAERFLSMWWHWIGPVVAAALLAILAAGLIRWISESRLNAALARADKESDDDQTVDRRTYWDRVIRMLRLHVSWGSVVAFVAVLLIVLGIRLDGYVGPNYDLALPSLREGRGFWTPLAAVVSFVVAAYVQTRVNRIVPPVGTAPG
jgi:hypothetical protein